MKYFFSLYIFFLSISSNLYANTNPQAITYTLNEVINSIDSNDSDIKNENHEFLSTFLNATLDKENDLIFASDNEVVEDERLSSVKKDLTNSSFFSSVLYAEQMGYLCNNVKKRLSQSHLFVLFPKTKLNVLLSVYLI